MLRLALVCFLVAMIAGLFGFHGTFDHFSGLARIVFFVAIAAFVISLAAGDDSQSRPKI